MHVALNTNLLLVDQNWLEKAKSNGLKSMLISCASIVPETYAELTGGGDISRFVEKLKLVIQSNMWHAINMVVSTVNMGQIKKTAEFMSGIGVKTFGATPMSPNTIGTTSNIELTTADVHSIIYDLIWCQEKLGLKVDIFEAIPKCAFPKDIDASKYRFYKRKCSAGVQSFTVDSEGYVRPCSHNPDVYGNILSDSQSEIVGNMSDWVNYSYIPAECAECNLLFDCLGGCRVGSYGRTGTFSAPDPWMNKERFVSDGNFYEKASEVTSATRIAVRNDLSMRRVKNNYLLYVPKTRIAMMINSSLYHFISKISDDNFHSVADIALSYNVSVNDKAFQKVLGSLLSMRIFIEDKHEERR